MSILCAGDTHVFQLGSLTCDCGLYPSGYPQGLWPAAVPRLTKPQPYPLSGGVIPGYTPAGPYRPQMTTPPPAGEAPPVSLVAFKAAQRAGASHLSADGMRAYCERFGATLRAEWDGNGWGSWWEVGEMAADAVKM